MIATNITAVQLTKPGVIRSPPTGRKLSPALQRDAYLSSLHLQLVMLWLRKLIQLPLKHHVLTAARNRISDLIGIANPKFLERASFGCTLWYFLSYGNGQNCQPPWKLQLIQGEELIAATKMQTKLFFLLSMSTIQTFWSSHIQQVQL